MKDEHLIAFGRRVRRIRTVLGLTTNELAARSGMTVSQLVSIEGGRCALTLKMVQALIQGLGCAPKVLLRATAVRSSLTLEDLAERWALFEPASPEVQAAALAILRNVARKRRPPTVDR